MTGLRAKWTIRVERLETRLAIGPDAAEDVQVSLAISGLARAAPNEAGDCIDHSPVLDWITHEWPRTTPTLLLQTRVNELLAFLFGLDKRVQDAWVSIYRAGAPSSRVRVGLERQVSRTQFEAQLRARPGRALAATGQRRARLREVPGD